MSYHSHIPMTLLPKVRSRKLMDACQHMPCTLRVASFIPGHGCSGEDTVVGCHVGDIGRGVATKVSDLHVAAGCHACHALIDRRDKRVDWIVDQYPAAFAQRLMLGVFETQSRWVQMGLLCQDMETV